MKHVISTLASDNRYTAWVTQEGVHTVERSVLVRGGAGLVNKHGTPEGVSTEVSNEDAEFLANHDHFKEHQKRGFVRIVSNSIREPDPDTAAQTMETDEGSRPRTPGDVEKFSKDKGLDKDEEITVTKGGGGKKK